MTWDTFMILCIALLFAAAVSAPFVIGVWTFIIEPALERRRERKLKAKRRKRMLSNSHRAATDDDSDEPAWLKRSKKRNQRQEARRLRIMKQKDPLAYRATINGRTKAQ
ncbi:hypothetical protein C6503_11910 [Candidatus Poribacteria bacterium]|nr:MAG: hypothetical protein C6503_11910 [Candidatus Poribacteria bacterium]